VTHTILLVIEILGLGFALHLAWALRRAGLGAGLPVLGVGFLAGLTNAYLPALAALREQVVLARPAMILGMIAWLGGWALWGLRGVPGWLALSVSPWRMVFGTGLLVMGLAGGLPPAFFWSAALGDIAVGALGLGLLATGQAENRGALIAWNALGLLDLAHVLALGVLHLAPFYAAHPDVARLGLLPLFGVPAFIALHLGMLRSLARRRAAVG
jgi:hypothetical protein